MGRGYSGYGVDVPDQDPTKRPGWYRRDGVDYPTYWDGERWAERKYDPYSSNVTLPSRPPWQTAAIIAAIILTGALIVVLAALT